MEEQLCHIILRSVHEPAWWSNGRHYHAVGTERYKRWLLHLELSTLRVIYRRRPHHTTFPTDSCLHTATWNNKLQVMYLVVTARREENEEEVFTVRRCSVWLSDEQVSIEPSVMAVTVGGAVAIQWQMTRLSCTFLSMAPLVNSSKCVIWRLSSKTWVPGPSMKVTPCAEVTSQWMLWTCIIEASTLLSLSSVSILWYDGLCA